MGTWSRTNILRSQKDIYYNFNLGTSQLCKDFLFGNWCFKFCFRSRAFTNKRRHEAPSGCILFSQILCCWDQLWDPRWGISCYSRFLPRVASLSRRRCAPNDRIHGSQESRILHDGSSFKSSSSLIEHVVISIWFSYQLHVWETTKTIRCIIEEIVSCAKGWEATFDQYCTILLNHSNLGFSPLSHLSTPISSTKYIRLNI